MPGTYTPEQIAREIERELNMRTSVYPRWIQRGRISPAQAEENIGIMRQVLADYRSKISPDLFDDAGTVEPMPVPPLSAYLREKGQGLLDMARADVAMWERQTPGNRPADAQIESIRTLILLIERALRP